MFEPTTTLVAASSVIRPDPDAPVRVPFQMNGVTYLMTEDEIQAHMDKVERLKKVALEEQASKATLIEVVNEEATSIGLKPQDLAHREGGEKFKQAQDAALMALKEKRDARLKKVVAVRQQNIEKYTWIKIHQNSKPAVLSVYDAWELHQALPLEGSREAYNPHQAVYLIVVV